MNKLLSWAQLMFIVLSGFGGAYAQTCATCPDQTTYGNNSWIGYIYDHNGSGTPVSNPFATYKGCVTESEFFDRNWGTGNPSCAASANNFGARYRMNKTFASGNYTFTIGADDGVRLSIDGGNTWILQRWGDNSYGTVSVRVPLAGNYNLVLEYYEKGGDARISFSYTTELTTDLRMPDSNISGFVTTCGGKFYASGGSSGQYGNNENRSVTFYPSNACEKIELKFTSLATESSSGCNDWDILRVYNGNSTSAPLATTSQTGCTSRPAPGTVVSTAVDGSLTVHFKSDGSNVANGWTAEVRCLPAVTVNAGAAATLCNENDVQLNGSAVINVRAPATILTDGFESGLGNWSLYTISNSTNWVANNGYSGQYTSRTGTQCATLQYSSSTSRESCMEYTFPSGYTDINISFYYIQKPWSGDFDELYVDYYNGSSWIELIRYGTAQSSWTASSLNVPNNAQKFRFRGKTYYGYGVSIDDVVIKGYAPVTATYSWTPSASVTSGAGTLTPVVAPSATTTYTLTATANGCTANSQVIVTVNKPSATLTSSSTTVCLGNTVSLGGTVTAPGAWTINLSSGGGSVSGTGNGTWSTTVTPSATTTYSISSVTGACTGTGTGSSTVTLPASSGSLAGNESATCPVNGNNWIHFYNPSTGNYLGAIHPNNQDLGNVTMTSYAGSPQVMYACADPANTLYHTAYMGRSWVIRSANASYSNGQNFPSAATVKLPFSDAELIALNNYANTATPGNPNDGGTAVPVTLANMMLTKYSGAVEDNSADNCAGGGVIRAVTASPGSGTSPQGISGASYKDFTIQQFSEFFLHKSPGNSPLPVELTNFSAVCDKSVKIQWSTASEQNSDKFILEKSNDLESWIKIGETQAAGNSNITRNYSYSDSRVWDGTSYYRLIQIDLNGTEKIYGPLSVHCSVEGVGINVYPNPSEGIYTVEIFSDAVISGSFIELTDLTGKVLDSRWVDVQSGVNQYLFDGSSRESGMYIVRFIAPDKDINPIKLILR